MPALSLVQKFVEKLGRKVLNLDTDTLKLALLDTAINPATMVGYADLLGEVANGFGYLTGGFTLTGTDYAEVAGVASLTADNIIFTPAGGGVGPWRYVAVYDDTSAGKEIVAYGDAGVEITVPDGVPFAIAFPSGNILTAQ